MRAKVMSFFVLLSMFLTGLVFHFWQTNSEEQFGEVVALSNKSNVAINCISSPTGKTLVPEGAILGLNDVYTLDYVYLIDLGDNENIFVFIDKAVFIKDNQEFIDQYGLINLNYDLVEYSSNQMLLTVKVSLNMPKNQT